eukprot:351987-Chlamydomonas_euryale.AAC.5
MQPDGADLPCARTHGHLDKQSVGQCQQTPACICVCWRMHPQHGESTPAWRPPLRVSMSLCRRSRRLLNARDSNLAGAAEFESVAADRQHNRADREHGGQGRGVGQEEQRRTSRREGPQGGAGRAGTDVASGRAAAWGMGIRARCRALVRVGGFAACMRLGGVGALGTLPNTFRVGRYANALTETELIRGGQRERHLHQIATPGDTCSQRRGGERHAACNPHSAHLPDPPCCQPASRGLIATQR